LICQGTHDIENIVALGVLVVSALVLYPEGIQLDNYDQAALVLVPLWGHWGYVLFAVSLGITCFSASLELNLYLAYITAQAFGWNWGQNQRPSHDARFSFTYTIVILLASLLMLVGIDPLKLTLFTMALTALILPFDIAPLLLLMNDEVYLRGYRNGWLSNTVVLVIGLVFVVALVAIALEIIGG
jgi:Mn2+/Fe2+ NRAMP family transporter